MSLNKIESPCIGVCVLDINDVCEGCYRKADEIGRWSILSEETKREVVNASVQRAKDLGRLIE
ncbi:MAG TPA: DUF1289 domain-containing protein [Cellvibrionales bacterium]|nr:DUF1289 domain-containing protein [Cellvibrionales bacterium]HAW14672.1 DUF1289 domain-containing protein [Cellvibrionales bacterium]HCX26881.1 DUF1289 domain-containing protein [Cellvibrionales bacterium]